MNPSYSLRIAPATRSWLAFTLTIISACFCLLAVPSAAAGWSWDLPPGKITISGKRNNVFYVGEPVSFVTNKAASRFEVRDYFGDLIDSGAITGTSFRVSASAVGWYKLYLYGEVDQGAPWGKVVGGTTFVIFRRNNNFPDMPASFEDGKYLVWDLKGNVTIRVTTIQEGVTNAVVSGLFFGIPNVTPANLTGGSAARFVGTDSQTHGNWQGAYGSDGFNIIGDTARYPSYASVATSGTSTFAWVPSTNDSRALQKTTGTDRVAACWYNWGNFHINVNLKDGQTHRVALYALDWDSNGPRAQTIEILDAATGAVLDRQQLGERNKERFESEDQVVRGVTGMGPQRHYVEDAANPDADIARLKKLIAIDKEMYMPFDPIRKRKLMIAFPNGTENLAGVRKVVEAFKDDVEYFEPRNEPNFGSSAPDFVTRELIPFYRTIKEVDPRLKVMGPGIVTIGPGYGLAWIDGFLRAGGGNYIDAFSFHAYNNVNGDFALAFASLDGLNELLARYGLASMEKWQTEQGYPAALYGSFQPRLQGRWTMVQMMAFEQYGIPKERNHLWYDRNHGFWDVPTWWENEDGSLNPAAPLMRVWSEELFGTTFQKALDFGQPGNQLYVGNLFSGPGKSVAAFMSTGSTDGQVELIVNGGTSLRCVSAFGAETNQPVTGGRVKLRVTELPVYVRLQTGQTITVVPTQFGSNLARQPGVTAKASGTGVHPIDPNLGNGIEKIFNGALENWFYGQGNYDHPWMDNSPGSPAWVEITLPAVQTIDRVIAYAAVPWQWEGTLLDYELQYDSGGQWVTIERVQEPPKTFKVYTPNARCTVDSFFSDRCVFQHSFSPVRTQKIRLLVKDVTWGGGATKDVVDAGGQTGAPNICLRELEIYNSSGLDAGGGTPPPASGSNQAPTVSISSPAADATFNAPASVNIQATASDKDGTVAKVEFFAGTTKLGESTAAPYSFKWDGVKAGSYALTAVAYDNAGASTTSSRVNITVGAVEVAASAKFLQTDSTTQGTWVGKYGKDGFVVAGVGASLPPYAAVNVEGNSVATWAPSTGDVRALQHPTRSDRVAACWYSPGLKAASSFTLDVNVGDTASHYVGLYALDWDNFGPRSETVQVIDWKSGVVLDERSLTGFTRGQYVTWEVKGRVLIKVINMNNYGNAVISGIFFDSAGSTTPTIPAPTTPTTPTTPSTEQPADPTTQVPTTPTTEPHPDQPVVGTSATFVREDTGTQGNWSSVYGRDGFYLAGLAGAVPSYATINGTGWSQHQWAPSTTDPRALQKATRVAGCWYTPGTDLTSSFNINLQLTDAKTHRVALYLLDWDSQGPRSETVEVLDAATGTILGSQAVSGFQNGKYLVWDLKGNVTVRVRNSRAGSNAVVGGIFFGTGTNVEALTGTTAARFVTTDTTTSGSWRGVYGVDGWHVLGGPANYPAYATVNTSGASTFTWAASTDDHRALEIVSATDRIAACWYSAGEFSIDVSFTDGKAHQVALYALDWDRFGPRSEEIRVVDAATGAVLDKRSISSFGGGQYLVWKIAGRVKFQVVNTRGGSNAVVAGLFFGEGGRNIVTP